MIRFIRDPQPPSNLLYRQGMVRALTPAEEAAFIASGDAVDFLEPGRIFPPPVQLLPPGVQPSNPQGGVVVPTANTSQSPAAQGFSPNALALNAAGNLVRASADAQSWSPVSGDGRIAQTRVKSVLVVNDTLGSVYVRTAHSATHDMVQRTAARVNPSSTSNSHVDYIGAKLIPVATAETSTAISAAYTAGAFLSGQTDSLAPIKYNNVNMGAGHACTGGHTITAVGHGKTAADIGSTWNGPASRTFIILRVLDADRLLVISNNSGTLAQWAFYPTSLAGQTLTHATGATNTASIVITADTTSTQIFPSLNNRRVALLVNDGPVDPLVTAVYTNCTFRIEEGYGIVNPPSFIAHLQAAPGDTSRTIADDSLYQDVVVRNVHAWHANGCISLDQSVTFNSAVNLQYWGAVQQNIPTVSGGDVLRVYMPGVNAISGNDYRAGVDITASAVIWDSASASWVDASNPPNRMAEIVSNAGVNKHGTVLGYSPVSNISTRRKATVFKASAGGFLSGASKKMYPTVATLSPTAGEVRRVLAYSHTYNAAATPDATVATWVPDGDSVVVTVDFHQTSSVTKISLPSEFDGCRAALLDSQGVRLLQERIVDGEGLSLACDASYGYAQVLLTRT